MFASDKRNCQHEDTAGTPGGLPEVHGDGVLLRGPEGKARDNLAVCRAFL